MEMIYFSFLVFAVCTARTYGDENVKYAAVVFRHGDRSPVKPYPTDPYRNESLWPVKFGELTNTGKMQHYAFGKMLRQRYSHLLSKEFDPREIYVRSTDVDRTLMSAQANLAGMYPPYDKSVWNPELMWQPIPVHTVPAAEDAMLAMEKHCPAYDKELERYKNTKAYKERLLKYKSLMDYLSANTGINVKAYLDIQDIYSTLYIESLYNFTLPNWTHSVFPDKLKGPACYSFTVETDTPMLARLKVGPLLKHVTNNIMNAITSEEGKHHKVNLYSGHDLNIGSLLNALGVYDGICPCYTSAIFFELLFDDSTKGHYLRISYRNNTGVAEPYVLDIPNCGTKCPVKKFMKLYDNLISVKWEYECNKKFPPLLAACFIIGLFIFATIYVSHKIHFARVYRRSSEHPEYENIALPTDPNKVVAV